MITDKYFAPELSKFTAAEIPDLSNVDDQQEHWLVNYLLNSALGPSLDSPSRQQIYNFLRQTQSAFSSYASARSDTLEFLESSELHIRRYVSAIGHWEDYLAHTWQAFTFFVRGQKRVLFKQGEGSELERLNSLHSRAKHAAEQIEAGKFVAESPLCVWLTNDGLRSTDAELSFEEAADALKYLARLADAVQNPAMAAEKLDAVFEADDRDG
jgi:hypothetical protein